MTTYGEEFDKASKKRAKFAQEEREGGESIQGTLDAGNRESDEARPLDDPENGGDDGGSGRRSPTRSERMNRALVELGLAAFKVHALIWTWRGAPARGNLPFFTIRGLQKFCNLTRPTIRKALDELTGKGWIARLPYNCHHKNTLYRLVAVRKIPPASKGRR